MLPGKDFPSIIYLKNSIFSFNGNVCYLEELMYSLTVSPTVVFTMVAGAI